MAKALFLDRDGTLNHDTGYMNNPDLFALLKGVPEALLRAQKAGFLFVIVSNQSGVGRGLITEEQLEQVHAKLDQLLGQSGIRIAHYGLCFHQPDDECDCRKPKPKLVLEAAQKLNIDLSQSFMIGDKWSDVECGVNSKVKHSFLVKTGNGAEDQKKITKFLPAQATVVEDLSAAVDQICQ